MKRIIAVACLVFLFVAGDMVKVEGADPSLAKRQSNLQQFSPQGTPLATKLNINRISAWYHNNGVEERNPSTGNSGLTYPRGTSQPIYAAGLVWGGLFEDGRTPVLRVNGSSYNTGTKPGAIIGIRTGIAEDPNAADVRIFRVRRDFATADLRQDAAEINSIPVSNVSDAQVEAVRSQYLRDWLEWPDGKGAPFYDADSNGVYNPQVLNGVPVLFPDADEPGFADGDQVIWYVGNDIGVAQPWAGPESGIEIQTTIWGYARSGTDPLGNVLFKRYRLIYKGVASTPANARINDMYMCQWSDPDIGDAGDDFAACDTVLSLGYAYNANPTDASYRQFGLAPPAAGYDFLQGPLVPGLPGQDLNKNGVPDDQDFGIFDLKLVGPGFINLPMTSFVFFAAGQQYSDPPFNANGGIQWYQMLRGLPPTPQGPPDPPPITNPTTGQPTFFWLSGDPVNRTGWLDSSPGDRRFLLSTGPFTMAVGDTQELVSAVVCGLGASNIKSITLMKFYDRTVQLAYDNLFDLPKPPSNPNLRIIELDKQLLLDWEFDSASVAKTEDIVILGGYEFEGYKVYQLPSATSDLSSATLIAQYDVVNGIKTILQEQFDEASGEILLLPAQLGSDNGIQRTQLITTDAVRARPLVNGQRYYFAVTAYNYTSDESKPIRTLESPPVIVSAVPETPKPGTRYAYRIGDTVSVKDMVGANDAVINPVIYNPTQQLGDRYHLRFDTTLTGTFVWSLSNANTGRVLFSNESHFSDTVQFRVPEAGFAVSVNRPSVGVKSVTDPSGTSVFGPQSTNPNYAVLSLTGSINALSGLGRTGRTFEVRFDGTGSYAVRLAVPPFIPIAVINVPFSVWDIGRSSSDTPVQVIAAVRDSANTPTTWNVTPNGIVQGGTLFKVFEPLYITAVPYPSNDSAGVFALRNTINAVIGNPQNPNSALINVLIADKDGDNQPPPTGTIIRFNKFLELRNGDVKEITPEKIVQGNVDLARQDIEAIKAFPNPYYGMSRIETTRESRFITFSHLPQRATIRIYNIAGVHVRTLEKNEQRQFMEWNLLNETGLPIASGIYIAFIDMPDLGVTKTIKLAIIQEQQFLRNF